MPIMLQPLDDKGQALQIMRTWITAMPGETLSCVGCHEDQSAAPLTRASFASRERPDEIRPWYGPTRGFGFVREVQPVLDRYCIGCHDEKHQLDLRGGRLLTDWATQMAGRWAGGGKFTQSYWELQRYVRRPGIESDRPMLTPMDFHFSTTELGQRLRKDHHGVKLDAESWDRLVTWADLNAPFFGRWSDIPGINTTNLFAMNQRVIELRKKYAPQGPIADPEVMPETPKYDSKPVAPTPITNHQSTRLAVLGTRSRSAPAADCAVRHGREAGDCCRHGGASAGADEGETSSRLGRTITLASDRRSGSVLRRAKHRARPTGAAIQHLRRRRCDARRGWQS